MFDIGMIFIATVFSLGIAVLTLPYAIILERIPNPKIRKILPLALGIFLVATVLIVNPQQNVETQRYLYTLKVFSPYLLLPLFIIAPLPFFGKKNRIFGRINDRFLRSIYNNSFLFYFLSSRS
jgi:hypothetical protein